MGIVKSEVNKKTTKLTIKDTDFLLKVLMKSTFEGKEVEQAYSVISKLADMHRRNIEN